MAIDPETEIPLRSYMLGDLNEDEQEDLEKRLMAEPGVFEELQLAEDELIDEYLEGDLPERDRAKFETFFLAAPERKQKLRFAESLKRYIAAHKPPKSCRPAGSIIARLIWPVRSPILKWALAASFLGLIGGGTWSTVRISGLRTALDRQHAEVVESQERLADVQGQNVRLGASLEQEHARSDRMEQEIATLKKNQEANPSAPTRTIPTTLVANAILASGRSRGSEDPQEIIVPPGDSVVKLELKMELYEFPGYIVALERLGEDQNIAVLSQQTRSTNQGQFSGLLVPAILLTEGNYVVKLSGINTAGDHEELRSYYFRAVKQ